MQTYTIIENYTIIKKQSKSNFKFNKIVKIALNCNCNSKV